MTLRFSWMRWVVLAVVGVLVSGCAPEGDELVEIPVGVSPSISVVATTGMVGDVVAAVAGEHAEVTVLMGAGIDPHLYAATRDDIQTMMDADIIFYNGLHLEGKITDAMYRARDGGKPVYALTETIDASRLITPEESDGDPDPHVWMDPDAWAMTVTVVRDALIDLDAERASEYERNAEAYLASIRELDAYATEVLSSVPEGARVLVTAHDAFNYFGKRFSYDVVGIQGISTESEAGVRDIDRIVRLLVDRGIGAVFVESTVSDRGVRSLIENSAALGHEVVIGGELFSDAMGDPGTYEGTYIGMIDHNVTTIARALGGEAPARGMHGKLAQ